MGIDTGREPRRSTLRIIVPTKVLNNVLEHESNEVTMLKTLRLLHIKHKTKRKQLNICKRNTAMQGVSSYPLPRPLAISFVRGELSLNVLNCTPHERLADW